MLIASQQEWNARSLESVLTPEGYRVVMTYTRTQALQQVGLHPDAVIIDEYLPDAEGHALCRELRATSLIPPQTPIFLALTHPPTRRDRLHALQAGAWACWGEPLDAVELLAMLAVFVPAKRGDGA